MTYAEFQKAELAKAEAFMAEHGASLVHPDYRPAGELYGHITADSVIMDIAIAEAEENPDLWDFSDTTLSMYEQAGAKDVTGLAHWQGETILPEDVRKSGVQTGQGKSTWRGVFIAEKFAKHERKTSKDRARHNIEFAFEKHAEGKLTRKQKAIVKTLNALPRQTNGQAIKMSRLARRAAKFDRS